QKVVCSRPQSPKHCNESGIVVEDYMQLGHAVRLVVALAFVVAGPTLVLAQITTGSVFGTVRDAQGAVVPGATAVLVSETRGTRTSPVASNTSGDFSIPNITADTY